MRRSLGGVAVLVIAGLVWLALAHFREAPPAGAAPAPGTAPPPRPAPAAPPAPGSTPPLDQAATPADGALEVRVLANGKPVADAAVRAYRRGSIDPNTAKIDWQVAGVATSAADGAARLWAKPGTYLVAVRASGLPVAFGEARRSAVEPVTRITVALAAGVTLSGRTVMRAGQEPVPLANLTLRPHLTLVAYPDGSAAPAPDEEAVKAKSDERGHFRVEGLSPGRWTVEASAPSAGRALAEGVQLPLADELVLQLSGVGFIQGFVRTAAGDPAQGAEVSACAGGEAQQATSVASASGAFSLELEPGRWIVSARRGDEAGTLDEPQRVRAGVTAGPVELRLGAAAALEGVVTSAATHQPLAQVHVDVSPSGANGDLGRAVTGPDGRFAVERLAPGGYDVIASLEGYADAVKPLLTVAAGQRFPLRLELHATGVLEGTVVDSHKVGVDGAQVATVYGYDRHFVAIPSLEARTGPDGRYLLAGVRPGEVTVTARREGAAVGAQRRLTLPEGGRARADFTLSEVGVLTGRVTTRFGALPRTAVVGVQPEGKGWTERRTELLDADGGYRLSVPTGSYEVAVFEREEDAWSHPGLTVAVAPGETVTHDMELHSFGGSSVPVTITVLDASGAPVAGALVHIANEEEYQLAELSTDEQGRCTTDLPKVWPSEHRPSVYSVDALSEACLGHATRIGDQQEITVQLAAPARIAGRVAGVKPGTTFEVSTKGVNFGAAMAIHPSPQEFTGEEFLVGAFAGETRVFVRTSDGHSGDVPITAVSGKTVHVELLVK